MTDLHLHDSVMYGDLHIHKSDPAFALAWAILKEEQEEPAPDPVQPKPSWWQRMKDGVSDFASSFNSQGVGSPLANLRRIRQRDDERNQDRTAQWEAQQQQLQEQQEQQEADASQSNLAQVFGHQEDEPAIDGQMTLDQFGQPQLPNLFDDNYGKADLPDLFNQPQPDPNQQQPDPNQMNQPGQMPDQYWANRQQDVKDTLTSLPALGMMGYQRLRNQGKRAEQNMSAGKIGMPSGGGGNA